MNDPLRERLSVPEMARELHRLIRNGKDIPYADGEEQRYYELIVTRWLEIVDGELGRLRAAAECVDPVYRDHTRFDLEKELRQATSDHRDLYLDMQRRTAERDEDTRVMNLLRRHRDEAEAENERLRRIENAARALVESQHQYIHNGNYSLQVTMTGYEPLAVSRSALDALAAEVERADEGEKR